MANTSVYDHASKRTAENTSLLLATSLRDAIGDGRKIITLSDVTKLTLEVMAAHRQEHGVELGFVAGMISSQGMERVNENYDALDRITRHMHTYYRDVIEGWNPEIKYSAPQLSVFSATTVFSKQLMMRFAHGPKKNWLFHWRDVFGEGSGEAQIQHLFLSHGWIDSSGSQDEKRTADRLGITTYDLHGDPKTMSVMRGAVRREP